MKNKTDIDTESNKINHNKTNIDTESNKINHNKTNIDIESNKINHNKTNIDIESNKINHNKTNIDTENKNSVNLNKNNKKHTINYFKEKNDLLKIENFELKNKIKKIKHDIWDLKLRSQSEIENIRRRSSIDIENAYKFSLEKFIYELLPVIDNLERSLELKQDKKNSFNISIIEGIKLTLKSLLSLIKKFGVISINDINQPFDPSKHQAMSIIESDKIKENYIIEVLQKGYILNNRLLRPAMVIVAKKKEKIND